MVKRIVFKIVIKVVLVARMFHENVVKRITGDYWKVMYRGQEIDLRDYEGEELQTILDEIREEIIAQRKAGEAILKERGYM